MKLRSNNILKDNSATDLSPAWAGSYQVVALPVGAVASASSSGTTATVKAGHGFAANDKALIYSSGTGTFVAEALSSVTGTTLVWSSATPTIADGDLICNLGPDTASGATPNYDASPMKIFNRADVSDAISASTVTSDSQGDYEYWTEGDGANWELVLDASGTVVGVVPGWAGQGRINPCDYGCIGDSTGDNGTDNRARMQIALNAAAWSGFDFYGPKGNFSVEGSLELKSNTHAYNASDFKLVKRFDTVGSTANAMVVSETYSTATIGASTSNDNIHWVGGRMTVGAANTYGGSMIGLHSDDGLVQHVTIEEFSKDSGGFGIHLYGNDGWIKDCKVYSTVTTAGGTDGVGRAAGSGGGISRCIVRSADDCFTTSVWYGGGISNVATSDMVVSDCHGESTGGGRVFTIATGTGGATTSGVERIAVSNITGTTDGPIIRIGAGNSSSTGKIREITVTDFVATAANDGAAVRAIYIYGGFGAASNLVEDVTLARVKTNVTSSASPVQGQVRIEDCDGVTLDSCVIDATGANAAMDDIVVCLSSKDVNLIGNRVRCQASMTGSSSIFQLGATSNEVEGGNVCRNIVVDMPTNGTAFDINEATGLVVSKNRVTLKAGVTAGVVGISDGGGTVEGNNVVTGNNLYPWLAFELADQVAGSTSLSTPAIVQLNEGDCSYSDNLGHDLIGFQTVAATASPSQGDSPLRARVNLVTTAAGSDGVTLPYASIGRRVTVIDQTGSGLEVYPAASDNATGGTNTAVTLSAAGMVTLEAINATAWRVYSLSGTFS